MNAKFTNSRYEMEIIHRIAVRASRLADEHRGVYDSITAAMDIEAVHANGNPLRLSDLEKADSFNFAHDVFGIRRHINRETGQLTDCFVPRFSL